MKLEIGQIIPYDAMPRRTGYFLKATITFLLKTDMVNKYCLNYYNYIIEIIKYSV